MLEAVGVADRLQREIAEPLRAGGVELRLSASIGIALAEPGEEVDPSRLVEDADAAMYRAKERGGDRTELFDMRMRERAVEELSIEQELQHGLEHGELRLFYQPLVNLGTGELVGAEALIRWDHPDRGMLEPRQVPPRGRGERPDRPGRRVGGRRGVPAAARLGPPGRRRARRSGSR